MGLTVLLDRMPELIELILANLRKKDLKAFSLASHDCRTLALPFIFSKTTTVEIHGRPGGFFKFLYSMRSRGPQLHQSSTLMNRSIEGFILFCVPFFLALRHSLNPAQPRRYKTIPRRTFRLCLRWFPFPFHKVVPQTIRNERMSAYYL